MTNPEHKAILDKGTEAWNAWRTSNPKILPNLSRTNLIEANLTGANLRRANLIEANLRRADLFEANLIGANLRRADLSEADLSVANLSVADLSEADLSEADLSVADLSEADLSGADLSGANLSGANFDQAILYETALANVDLSTAKGLKSVRHFGPSSIGIDTFFKSKGKIPEVFLIKAGVPDVFIPYASSMAGTPFEFYSCFISYSAKDEAFAQRLHADLQGKGVRCWFAPEDLKIGEKFRTRIDEAIKLHDKLLLVLSENSVQSDWVEKEVETAFEKERKEKRTVLFPIRLDDLVMEIETGWSADIRRSRHIGDFRKWKNHDQYQNVFNRLLRDLNVEQAKKPPQIGGLNL